MLKFYRDVKIHDGSHLVITHPDSGFCGTFLSELLVSNNNFNYVGIFYSKYLSPVIRNNANGQPTFNAEVFYNEEKNVLHINFLSLVSADNLKKFYEEFESSVIRFYKVGNVTFIGGVFNFHIFDDKELFNKNVDIFYISNYINENQEKELNIRKFDKFLDIPKKKENDEFKLIEGKQFVKTITKLLGKSNINYSYLFTFANASFDAFAGYGLYKKLCYVLKLSNNDEQIIREYNNSIGFLVSLAGQKIAFSENWSSIII